MAQASPYHRTMHLSTEDFEELERRVAQRDAAAFDTLRRAYQGLVHKFVESKVPNPSLASEITSQIFRTAWEKCDRYAWRDFSYHVWLIRITNKELDDRGLLDHREQWLDRVL
ncbi:MAG: hypothetical protein HY534_04955 [Chloroflexi bacterium]|nr:hypothetical protein [Chloroflexota bacterium]